MAFNVIGERALDTVSPLGIENNYIISASIYSAFTPAQARRIIVQNLRDYNFCTATQKLDSERAKHSLPQGAAAPNQIEGKVATNGVVYMRCFRDSTNNTGIIRVNHPVVFCTVTGNSVTGINNTWAPDEYKIIGIALDGYSSTEPEGGLVPVRIIDRVENIPDRIPPKAAFFGIVGNPNPFASMFQFILDVEYTEITGHSTIPGNIGFLSLNDTSGPALTNWGEPVITLAQSGRVRIGKPGHYLLRQEIIFPPIFLGTGFNGNPLSLDMDNSSFTGLGLQPQPIDSSSPDERIPVMQVAYAARSKLRFFDVNGVEFTTKFESHSSYWPMYHGAVHGPPLVINYPIFLNEGLAPFPIELRRYYKIARSTHAFVVNSGTPSFVTSECFTVEAMPQHNWPYSVVR